MGDLPFRSGRKVSRATSKLSVLADREISAEMLSASAARGLPRNLGQLQCKHYEGMLPVPNACEDDGKVIFHAFKKKFRPPRRCIFVAPRGPTTELRDMLLNHDKLKAEIISTWDKRVANKVVAGKTHILAGELPTTFTRTTLVRLAIPLSTKSWTRIGARPIGRRDLGDIYRRRPSAKLPMQSHRRNRVMWGSCLRYMRRRQALRSVAAYFLAGRPSKTASALL
jgi:hypothetical protein